MNYILHCANEENCSYTLEVEVNDAETFDQIVCPNCGDTMVNDRVIVTNGSNYYTPDYSE